MLESTSIAENGTVLIISGKRCRIADLSFSDLEHRLATGQAYTKSGSGRNRVMGYRNGVMTRLGDLEASVWETLIRDLIHRSSEDALLQGLIAWAADNCPWLHTKAEIEQHALELHSSRIFENPAIRSSIGNTALRKETQMNTAKKSLEIIGNPVYPLCVGKSAYITESDGVRVTSRVLAIDSRTQTEIAFETLNTHYLLHLQEMGGTA